MTTRDTARACAGPMQHRLRLVHSAFAGIVPAENAGLHAASGELLLFIDDDAVAPPEWLARHVAHYTDPSVGAVGAPVRNYHADGRPYPASSPGRIGELTFYGRLLGNLFDHPPEWCLRPAIQVDHLAAGNMSLRRTAFNSFDTGLLPYWQAFELDACLQVHTNGLQVLFDFSNSIDHYPTNSVFIQDRNGNLQLKVFHAAYNHAFILAKHSRLPLRALRYLYLLMIGSAATPGIAAFFLALFHFGNFRREFRILIETLRWRLRGWKEGSGRRTTAEKLQASATAQRPLARVS